MNAALQERVPLPQAEQCRHLASALTLTQQMLRLADAGEWARVTELESQRREDLAACFSVTTLATDSELIAEAIAALLYLNEELMSRLKEARDQVMEQGREHAKRRRAAESYGIVDLSSS
ncbi:flagellar protein FliT [Porticoccus sp.]